MSVSDPVSDLLARLRNAIHSRHAKLDVPASKLKLEIARILKEEGYISNYKATEENSKRFLRVYLKYDTNNQAAIRGLARVSHPDAASTCIAMKFGGCRAGWASASSPRRRA
jgi:small subunit ribosomal protein S8